MLLSGPWFADWNYRCLQALFQLLPHTLTREDWCEFWIENPLVGTWLFALFFYRFWSISDSEQPYRRGILFRALAALTVAFLLTLAVRPWIKWPSPLRNPEFQGLFPQYLWGGGTQNCFPSHSTLVYFAVALGFWPLRKSLSVFLAAFALLAVSLPRVYLGGHYPIDVLFSCLLILGVFAAASVWKVPEPITRWLSRQGRGTRIRDCLFFLWIFEVGEGFRGAEFMAGLLRYWKR
jgi:membrane-associated phospholipid phosphatase